MTRTSSIAEGRTQLSRLVAMAGRRVKVGSSRAQTPVARLAPIARSSPRREPGAFAGRVGLAEDFDVVPEDVGRALGIVD